MNTVAPRPTCPLLTRASLVTFCSALLTLHANDPVSYLEAPVTQALPRIEANSATLINGRRVTPAGTLLKTQSYHWGMSLSPNERRLALVSRDSIEIADLTQPLSVRRYPPYGQTPLSNAGTGGYMGVAFDPSGQHVYYGSANEGQIKQLDLASGAITTACDLDDADHTDSFVGDFVLNRRGNLLFAVDQHNYRLVVVNLQTKQLEQSIRVGRNPFALSLTPDEQAVWVSNVGMFEYPLIPGVTPQNRATAGLDFPAYGIPSPEAESGRVIDGRLIPGLGSPNHPDAMSVFRVDLAAGAVDHKIKTGFWVGTERGDILTVGGASPASIAIGSRRVYVANATNDSITVIDQTTGKIVAEIELTLPRLEQLRGILPFGLALSPDQKQLYAACAGLNAVAVINTTSLALEGFIPSSWFCSFVEATRDGQHLIVYSAKGLGSGPNGGRNFQAPARGTHPGDIMQGIVQIVPVPDSKQLATWTQQVIDNTYTVRSTLPDPNHPLPLRSGHHESPIRHLVFIVKENRTFDQVYGARSHVRGDPSLVELGLKMNVTNQAGTRSINQVDISPNHHALADQFAISDNFYCDADQSNTGHRWVVGVYPNEWVEVNARSRIEQKLFSSAPGRRYVSGANAVVNPEDYNEAGALWEHLHRHQIPFFNFGFGTEMPGSVAEQVHRYTGFKMTVSFPLPKPLLDNTSRKFATYNMAIPDQFRVDMFEEEYRDKWAKGQEPFPRLITMVLPNDHLTGEHPDDGFPFRESYMADNDLALGRVVQTLSHSPYWRHMLIIVTEDDSQGGHDHIDAHRSLLLLISPHVKRGFVSHHLTSFGSLMRLMFNLLDLPPLNQFDATAAFPHDLFTDQPDFTPYRCRPIDKRLFDPDQAFKPFDHRFNWGNLLESPDMDDLDDMRREQAR